MEYRIAPPFCGSGYEQVGDLAAPLAVGSKQTLHLARPPNVLGSGFDQHENGEGADKLIPFASLRAE